MTALRLDHHIGIEAIAQVDLDTRPNRHQPLEDLAAMAPSYWPPSPADYGPTGASATKMA